MFAHQQCQTARFTVNCKGGRCWPIIWNHGSQIVAQQRLLDGENKRMDFIVIRLRNERRARARCCRSRICASNLSLLQLASAYARCLGYLSPLTRQECLKLWQNVLHGMLGGLVPSGRSHLGCSCPALRVIAYQNPDVNNVATSHITTARTSTKRADACVHPLVKMPCARGSIRCIASQCPLCIRLLGTGCN